MNKELQFLLYTTPNENIKIGVVVNDETLWLTQKAMAELFGVGVPAISKHIKNIFEEGELSENTTVSKMETVEAASSSPVSKIFFKCLLIAGTFTPNNSAMAFWVSQKVPS